MNSMIIDRCIDIFLSTLLSENSDNVGLLNANCLMQLLLKQS